MDLKVALREHSLANVLSPVALRERSLANILSPIALRARMFPREHSLPRRPSRERSLANVLSPIAPRKRSLAIAESFSFAPLSRIRTYSF